LTPTGANAPAQRVEAYNTPADIPELVKEYAGTRVAPLDGFLSMYSNSTSRVVPGGQLMLRRDAPVLTLMF